MGFIAESAGIIYGQHAGGGKIKKFLFVVLIMIMIATSE